MKKFITLIFLISVVNGISSEDKPITSTINNEVPNPEQNLPPGSERTFDGNPLSSSEDMSSEAPESISNIKPGPDNILPPDAEKSLNQQLPFVLTPDGSKESINGVPSDMQEGINIINSSPNTLTPSVVRSLNNNQQSQLILLPGTNEEAKTVFNSQTNEGSKMTPRVFNAITKKCRESHDGVIVFPGEPRPIICDSFGSSTTTRTTRQDYDPSEDIFTSSTAGTTGSSTSVPKNYENCMTSCKISSLYKPVCGTDFITYFNFDHINCARKCGIDVLLLLNRECDHSTSEPISTTPIVPTTSTQNPAAFAQCLLSCPVTPEYYPVCGSDLVSYTNPSKLFCARKCGKDVNEVRKGRCPTRVPTTTLRPIPPTKTPKPIVSTTLSPAIKSCISECIVTSEYNPVCGSDLVTYTNPARLHCAKLCGVDVRIVRQGRCRGN